MNIWSGCWKSWTLVRWRRNGMKSWLYAANGGRAGYSGVAVDCRTYSRNYKKHPKPDRQSKVCTTLQFGWLRFWVEFDTPSDIGTTFRRDYAQVQHWRRIAVLSDEPIAWKDECRHDDEFGFSEWEELFMNEKMTGSLLVRLTYCCDIFWNGQWFLPDETLLIGAQF